MVGVNEPHTPKALLLGAELRELREQAGLNVRELAAALDVGQATVSRYERGERTPSVDYVARILGTLRVGGAKYDEVIDFARNASEPNLIAGTKPGMHRHLLDLAEFERKASRIVQVAPLMIPGTMQTREYAMAVMTGLPEEDRDLRVELRMARREVLAGPQIEVFLMERCVRDALCGPKAMAEQVRYLVEVADQSNVTVQIIPADLHQYTLAHEGTFVLYDFPKANPIVQLENYRGSAFLNDRKDVAAYRDAVATLADAAMSPDQSIELMAAIAEQLEGESQR